MMKEKNIPLIIAGLVGFAGVALGAFGAHALQAILTEEGRSIWETGVLYHLVHAAVLTVLAFQGRRFSASFWCFLAGIILFSGSLYALAWSGLTFLGAITPFGGLSLLAGWGILFWKGFRPGKE